MILYVSIAIDVGILYIIGRYTKRCIIDESLFLLRGLSPVLWFRCNLYF